MLDFLDLSGFWDFASAHPFWAWMISWCIWVVPAAIAAPFNAVFLFWNRWLRHRNIALHGWPTTPSMDADGDIVHPKTTNP